MSRTFNRKGSVVGIVPVMVITLIVIAALTIDYGNFHAQKSSMQNAADAAALAAAMRIGNINSAESRDEARIYASAFANYNQVKQGEVLPAENVVFGNWDPKTDLFTTAVSMENVDAIQVTVIRGSAESNYLSAPFMSFFGLRNVAAATQSVTTISGASSAYGIPIALRSPEFGPIIADLTTANPDDDGPSPPSLNQFYPNDEVVVLMYGNENVAHLTLAMGASGSGASYSEVKDVLAARRAPIRLQVGDECEVLSNGADPDEFAAELVQRLSLFSDDPDRTIIMPVVGPLESSRDEAGVLNGSVRIEDFVPVYLSRTDRRHIYDPSDPSRKIWVDVLIGEVVTKRVNTDWGGGTPSGVGGKTLRIIELVK